jgi:hypothetical protein
MKIPTSVITLAGGTALGVAVLVASIVQTPSGAAPVSYGATSPASAGTNGTSGTAVTSPAPAPASSAAGVTSTSPSPSSAASSTPSVIPTTPPPVPGPVPTNANYAAQVNGGAGAAVAVSVHGKKAVAYVCDGHHVGHWFNGTVKGGKLDLAGKSGAHITLNYRSAKAAGYVKAAGHQYTFSAPTLHTSSTPTLHERRAGLYEAIGMVHGKKMKFGWIVLSNGYQVGAAEVDPDSADPQVTTAPPLDVATGTAQDDGVTLTATLISGTTGSGF